MSTYTFTKTWYEKTVKIDGVLIVAYVRKYGLNEEGKSEYIRRIDYESWSIGTQEYKLKKAHEWADNVIKLAQQYEVGRETYTRIG